MDDFSRLRRYDTVFTLKCIETADSVSKSFGMPYAIFPTFIIYDICLQILVPSKNLLGLIQSDDHECCRISVGHRAPLCYDSR